jgi:hypothetical protein
LFSIVAAALVALPSVSRAEASTNTPPATAPAKKHGAPFHGKVAAVDTAAATVTVGTLTINITSETKITKDGKPATLSDIVVGETVGGSYKKDDAGKLNAATLRVGEKAPKADKKKKDAPAAK